MKHDSSVTLHVVIMWSPLTWKMPDWLTHCCHPTSHPYEARGSYLLFFKWQSKVSDYSSRNLECKSSHPKWSSEKQQKRMKHQIMGFKNSQNRSLWHEEFYTDLENIFSHSRNKNKRCKIQFSHLGFLLKLGFAGSSCLSSHLQRRVRLLPTNFVTAVVMAMTTRKNKYSWGTWRAVLLSYCTGFHCFFKNPVIKLKLCFPYRNTCPTSSTHRKDVILIISTDEAHSNVTPYQNG